jgi:hypothetical protein
MVVAIVLFVIIIIYWILHFLFFKEYSIVMANFETLVKVLETRDLILMRVLPEIKDKKVKDEMTNLVSEQLSAKKQGNDKLIENDVAINKKLDVIYRELDKSKNPLVKEELRRLVQLEKSLKTIRREYSKAVDQYNEKLVKHPKSMIKFWKMKPLNTYKIKE